MVRLYRFSLCPSFSAASPRFGTWFLIAGAHSIPSLMDNHSPAAGSFRYQLHGSEDGIPIISAGVERNRGADARMQVHSGASFHATLPTLLPKPADWFVAPKDDLPTTLPIAFAILSVPFVHARPIDFVSNLFFMTTIRYLSIILCCCHVTVIFGSEGFPSILAVCCSSVLPIAAAPFPVNAVNHRLFWGLYRTPTAVITASSAPPLLDNW